MVIPSDEFVYGFFKRIDGHKGINELFIAYRDLLNKYKDIHLA